ncbi:ubiquinone biosynthesis coq-4 mitochondrial [Pseudohyphozyma bogoriensis]|nr:ubiquinone biosynthesis coq-4 mitochondrial [Pseudohyphozyma bogoriensis]
MILEQVDEMECDWRGGLHPEHDSILAVSRTCKRLLLVSTPFLWQDLTINSEPRWESILRALVRDPVRATFIRTLVVLHKELPLFSLLFEFPGLRLTTLHIEAAWDVPKTFTDALKSPNLRHVQELIFPQQTMAFDDQDFSLKDFFPGVRKLDVDSQPTERALVELLPQLDEFKMDHDSFKADPSELIARTLTTIKKITVCYAFDVNLNVSDHLREMLDNGATIKQLDEIEFETVYVFKQTSDLPDLLRVLGDAGPRVLRLQRYLWFYTAPAPDSSTANLHNFEVWKSVNATSVRVLDLDESGADSFEDDGDRCSLSEEILHATINFLTGFPNVTDVCLYSWLDQEEAARDFSLASDSFTDDELLQDLPFLYRLIQFAQNRTKITELTFRQPDTLRGDPSELIARTLTTIKKITICYELDYEVGLAPYMREMLRTGATLEQLDEIRLEDIDVFSSSDSLPDLLRVFGDHNVGPRVLTLRGYRWFFTGPDSYCARQHDFKLWKDVKATSVRVLDVHHSGASLDETDVAVCRLSSEILQATTDFLSGFPNVTCVRLLSWLDEEPAAWSSSFSSEDLSDDQLLEDWPLLHGLIEFAQTRTRITELTFRQLRCFRVVASPEVGFERDDVGF